jgi:hypothetical protein
MSIIFHEYTPRNLIITYQSQKSHKPSNCSQRAVQVVVGLDIPADVVQVMYREFWELTCMHKLNVIYEEIESFPSFLKLHKIVEEQGMSENEVINVLKLANNNELPYLQEKVEYLRHEINNLEL